MIYKDQEQTPDQRLLGSAERGDAKGMKAALGQGADINARNELKRTPLHITASGVSIEALNVLLEDQYKDKLQIDAVDQFGNTPLRMAVEHRNKATTLALLSRTADIEAGENRLGEKGKDMGGETVMHRVANWEDPEIARAFIRKGARVTQVDHPGISPHQRAEKLGANHAEVAQILKDAWETQELIGRKKANPAEAGNEPAIAVAAIPAEKPWAKTIQNLRRETKKEAVAAER